ncbi:MAG: hypothetical protein JW856_04345 [Dehalococcoidales bacterium]|nr:hypothetical protein [Dehalococcoidales bacterium]
MLNEYWGIPAIIGAVFFVLGIALIIWGVREGRNYYDSLINRVDLREFFSKWPLRPEPGALKTGGWISIILSIIIVGIGVLLYLLNK